MLPRISIVTPSLNQGQFLEQTIVSVLGQCYENLEFIVIDGGSSDESVPVIRKYSARVAFWSSEPDSGQANAINSGFARATGDILGWVNSDDFYFPCALHEVASEFRHKVDMVYGRCFSFGEGGGRCLVNDPPEPASLHLEWEPCLVQPSVFWTRELWGRTGPLDESLHYAFDWDWFRRACAGARVRKSRKILSAYRFHPGHKSQSGNVKRRAEMLEVAARGDNPRVGQTYRLAQDLSDALARHYDLTTRIKGRGLKQAAKWARCFCPSLWRLPKGIQFEQLTAAHRVLR